MKNRVFLLSVLACSVSMAVQANSFSWNKETVNLTNVKKIASSESGYSTNEPGSPWPGIGPNGEAEGTRTLPYSRIPALTITEDNKLVAMFDLRWGGAGNIWGHDMDRIDPGVAISSDGGHSWVKKTAWNVTNSQDPRRRAMDPTLLYNHIDGSLYVMHGNWSGPGQWYGDRFNHYTNDRWSATIHKSTDSGLNWEKNAEFSRTSNPGVFSKVQKGAGHSTIGFLGGVGSGIVMRDGTLVFPIQTAHDNGIATTIMYSKDNGKTWDMPATTTPPTPNGSSLENMVFEIDNKLVMTGRAGRAGDRLTDVPWRRWAYYSEDMGVTWHKYAPLHGFNNLGTRAQPSQGSAIYVTLPSGKRVLLVSTSKGEPTGNHMGHDNHTGYKRANLSLYVADARNPQNIAEIGDAIIRPGLGNTRGAGYTSLGYKEGVLFVTFEDDGNISIKNLSEYIPLIEAKATEWGLQDERAAEIEKINALPHLNKGQKTVLSEKMQHSNDNAIAQSNVLNREMLKLKDKSADLNTKSLTKPIALPSKMRLFNTALSETRSLTATDNTTFLDYTALQALMNNLDHSYLALDEKLDFSKYVNRVKQVRAYDTDINHSSYDTVFVEYDSVFKNDKQRPAFSLGANAELSPNAKVGAFIEHEKQSAYNSKSVGLRAKYTNGQNQLSGFIRFRKMGYENFIESQKNIDLYVNYTRAFSVNDKLTISPFIGAYASHSSRTKLDEDAVINQRVALASDIGANIEYKFASIKFSIRPSVALLKDDLTISQSNFKENQHKMKSNRVVSSVNVGLEKQFSNALSLGIKSKWQKYNSQSSDTSIGVNLSYNF